MAHWNYLINPDNDELTDDELDNIAGGGPPPPGED